MSNYMTNCSLDNLFLTADVLAPLKAAEPKLVVSEGLPKISTPEPIKVARAKNLNITKGFQVTGGKI
jgi:hypothetical protein